MLAAAGFGLAAVLPLLAGESGAALESMVLAAAYVIMAPGLNVVIGFAGLLDLGHVAFFAIGAHVAAYFGSAFWGIFILAMVVLGGLGSIWGLVAGAIVLSGVNSRLLPDVLYGVPAWAWTSTCPRSRPASTACCSWSSCSCGPQAYCRSGVTTSSEPGGAEPCPGTA